MDEDPSKNKAESCHLDLQRPIYKQSEFNNVYQTTASTKLRHHEESACSSLGIKPLLKSYDPRRILSIFSILNVVATYSFKNYFVSDIMSGLTVGVMNIPQALAFAALTSLSPVTGLYTSFVPSLTYVIFGTSRHLSVGTFAIVSLMIYSSVSRLEVDFIGNNKVLEVSMNSTEAFTEGTGYITEEQVMEFRLKVATSLCFWCGIIQITFAAFKFGFIFKYASQPMLRAFNTAAAFHGLSTQMKHVFGIYAKPKPHRLFKIVYRFLAIFENIKSINWIAFGISTIAVSLMLFCKEYLAPKFKKQLRGLPIPVELFVVISGITVSFFFNLNTTHDLAILGHIPSGMASASLPDFSLISSMGTDAILISIVAIASSISQADLYARKHQYKINANKEILALGMSNIFGSFFQCFTCAGALSRTALADSSGGKTQLVTVLSSSIVLLVLLVLSPLLQPLPNACLGSIIIVALLELYKQVSDISYYWRLDKISFATWVITFLSTLLLGFDIGLCCGFLAVLLLNTYRAQTLDVIELGQVENFDIFINSKAFNTQELSQVKIIQPSQSILYVNCESLQKQMNDLCPLKRSAGSKKLIDNCIENYTCKSTEDAEEPDVELKELKKDTVATIIFDFSMVAVIDEAGVKSLVKIVNDYKNEDVTVLLASVNDKVLKFFGRMGCKWEEIIYLSVKDAVSATLINH